MRNIDKVIIHCSATPEGKEYKVEDIDRWHRQRGFKMIGYHYVVYLDGSVHTGREESMAGAHCTGHNKNSIGICYIGGCDSHMKPKDTRTEEQRSSLVILVKDILDRYGLTTADIHVHNEYDNKACPSFSREDFLIDYDNIIGSIVYADKK